MDLLTPLVSNFSPSVKTYFSGKTCLSGGYDGLTPVGHLHVIKSGNLTVGLQNGQEMFINQPTVLFFPRPYAHHFRPDEFGVELVCCMVDLGFAEQNPLTLSLPEVVCIPLAELSSIGATLDLLYQEAFSEEIGRQMALDHLFEYFIIHVIRYLISKGQFIRGALAAMSDPKIAHALNAMHQKPSHPWTLEELAHLSSMSRSRFSEKFRLLTGITPLDYLTTWRLAVARGQLRQGKSLKTIATMVGYQSPEALSKVFQKKVGQTPAQWIKRLATT